MATSELTAKFNEMKQLRQINGKLQELVDARQPAPPTQYSIFERIVAIAERSTENYAAACTIIESQFFNGQVWTGGELTTMQAYEAALEFGVRAMGKGWTFDVDQKAWLDGDGKPWGGAAVRRKIVGIAGEARGEEVTQ